MSKFKMGKVVQGATYTVELTAQEIAILLGDTSYVKAKNENTVQQYEVAREIRQNAIEKLKEAFFPKATKLWNEERKA